MGRKHQPSELARDRRPWNTTLVDSHVRSDFGMVKRIFLTFRFPIIFSTPKGFQLQSAEGLAGVFSFCVYGPVSMPIDLS